MVKQIEMENILAQGDLNQAIDSNTRDINGTKAAIQQVELGYILSGYIQEGWTFFKKLILGWVQNFEKSVQ